MARSKIGILQGRLTRAEQLQAFPTGEWEQEFAIASDVGFDTLEWLLDNATGDQNPLWSVSERARIRHLSKQYHLPVATLCADYIQQSPLSIQNRDIRQQRIERFKRAIECAAEIGVQCILVPCFDRYLLPGTVLEDGLVAVLQSLGEVAQAQSVHLGLEMNWRAADQVALVRRVAHPSLGIYYDLGNSTAQGYSVAEDVQTIGPLLVGVHIKDRLVGGGSVLLGEGDTRFEAAFAALQEAGFVGPLVFETPRGGNPIQSARSHLEHVKTLLRGIAG